MLVVIVIMIGFFRANPRFANSGAGQEPELNLTAGKIQPRFLDLADDENSGANVIGHKCGLIFVIMILTTCFY